MSMNASFAEQVRTPGALSPEEMARVQQLYENILLETSADSMTARIPRTYAEALFTVAAQRNAVAPVAANFHSLINDVFPQVHGLEAFLDSAAVNRKAKDAALVKLFDGKAEPLFLDFLRVLNRKDRLGMLRLVGLAFRAILDEQTNRQRVLVETAVPLADDQKQALSESLAAALGKTPILVIRERPELIGGLIVHAGDRVFDTSVRTRLQTLRNKLLARGTHEIQSRRDRFSTG